MKLFSFITLLATAVGVIASEPPSELQIETLTAAKECPQQSAKGDRISVHYVSPPKQYYFVSHSLVLNHRPDMIALLDWHPAQRQEI